MTILDALILGIVQGITEFLPVSSSGHLVFIEEFLGLHIAELKSFDIAVHFGTFVAILIYFWKDFLRLIPEVKNPKLNGTPAMIVFASIPAALAGVFLEDKIDALFRNTNMVALMMIFVGIIFILAEFANKRVAKSNLTFVKALIIGLAQALALIPGVSRSGSTISAGLAQGIDREKAAKFSFLLGAPIIFGAAAWTLIKSGVSDLGVETLVGFITSAVTGFFAVSFLMKFLKKHSLNIFAIYLVLVGIILLFV